MFNMQNTDVARYWELPAGYKCSSNKLHWLCKQETAGQTATIQSKSSVSQKVGEKSIMHNLLNSFKTNHYIFLSIIKLKYTIRLDPFCPAQKTVYIRQ